ncbi:MAG: glycoside hydrolase family 25 protein [Nocardioidaceae bacterium]
MTGLLTTVAGAASASNPGGLDTSHYQHSTTLNWAAVKASGAKFAFLKATEGGSYRDPYFAADWAATQRNGIYRGAYHFARPSVGSAAAQAKYFARVIGPQTGRGTLPPVLDLEATGGLTPKQLIAWTHTWLSTVQSVTHRDPIIYVSPSFWESHLNNNTGFHHYPLWVAHYGVSQPRIPGGWPTWSFWQSTSSARISGVSGNVDRDVFNGSLIQLQKFALAFAPSGTTLTLAASNPAPMSGQSVTLSGVLKNSAGTPLGGKRVALRARATAGSAWAPLGSVLSSRTGAYSFRTTVTAAQSYQATFAGNQNLKPSASPVTSVTLTPRPTSLSLAASAHDALAGSTVTFSGTLATGATTPVAGQVVAISQKMAGSATWKNLSRITTDSRGTFAAAVTTMKSASYRASFAGTSAYAATASPAEAIAVTRNPTALTFAAANSAPYAEHLVTMTGTLRNGTNAVVGRTVTVQRQLPGSTTWSTVASAKTDVQGAFSVQPRVDKAATYRAVFTGDPLYTPSTSTSAALTITPPSVTRLTLTAPSATSIRLRRGASRTLSGTFATPEGAALPGRSVQLWKRVIGTTEWHRVARTVTLAPRGAWHFTVQPARTCTFQVRFAGGTRYAASHSVVVHVHLR